MSEEITLATKECYICGDLYETVTTFFQWDDDCEDLCPECMSKIKQIVSSAMFSDEAYWHLS
jgi:predicted nucleic acid-binding Zn ribbon protein